MHAVSFKLATNFKQTSDRAAPFAHVHWLLHRGRIRIHRAWRFGLSCGSTRLGHPVIAGVDHRPFDVLLALENPATIPADGRHALAGLLVARQRHTVFALTTLGTMIAARTG